MTTKKEEKFNQLRQELKPAQVDLIHIDQKQSACQLDHSGDPRGLTCYPATNTLMLKIDNGLIPLHVCEVCSNSLHEENSEWYLFICFNCMETKWVHKNYIHRTYSEQIIGMNECPNCAAETIWDC